jgi:flagellar basal-body rod protein FlgG
MIKGIYSSEASMRPKMTRMEVLAHNLANIDTVGFKKDRVFVEMLKEKAAASDGRGDLDNAVVEERTDFTEGALRQTGNPFDVALQGRGFFVVDTPRGTRLTRNGTFTLGPQGFLQTPEGYMVQGAAGPIRVPDSERLDAGKVSITEEGEILMDRDIIGRLRVVDVPDVLQLEKEHQAYFATTRPADISDIPDAERMVRQGYVEESNVDGIEEMITMIELSRSFEADQRMIQAQDATLDKTMDVGRV